MKNDWQQLCWYCLNIPHSERKSGPCLRGGKKDVSAIHWRLRFEMSFEFSPQSSQTKAWNVRGWEDEAFDRKVGFGFQRLLDLWQFDTICHGAPDQKISAVCNCCELFATVAELHRQKESFWSFVLLGPKVEEHFLVAGPMGQKLARHNAWAKGGPMA